VPFIVAPNPGALPRTGQILIADVTLSINQDAGPSGIVSSYSVAPFAGGGSSSTPNLGDGGPALGAYLNPPGGLAFDTATSNLYLVDGSSRIRITQWGPESKFFSANVGQPGKLVVKLFSYPAWRVEVNNRPVQTAALKITGQMVIPVDAGDNQVRITFVPGRDRKIGGSISLATGILILGALLFNRRSASSKLLTP